MEKKKKKKKSDAGSACLSYFVFSHNSVGYHNIIINNINRIVILYIYIYFIIYY